MQNYLGKIEFNDVILIISLIINVLLVIKTHGKTIRDGQYEYIESQFTNILKIQLEYPDFRKDNYWDELKDKSSTDALRYVAYCCLVWNTLETLWDKYGKKELARSSFYPGMKSLAKRHKKWLFESGSLNAYNTEMITFLINDRSLG
jgi:hypothetical protein